MTQDSEASEGKPWLPLLSWGILASVLSYAAWIHYGIGPVRPGHEELWYAPSGFLFESEALAPILAQPGQALGLLCLPALLGMIAILLTARSAIAKALAFASLAATVVFVFYGVMAPFPWQFFHWRGSAVLTITALTIGFAVATPWLAASWLRLGWPWRVAVLLPFVAFVIGFLRNATGTDRSLPFAISPWPAIPVFGLEVGALFIAIGLLGTGLGATATARAAKRSGAQAWGSAVVGLAVGLGAPLVLLLIGSALSLFPFKVGAGTLLGVTIACSTATAIAVGGALWGAVAVAAAALLVGFGTTLDLESQSLVGLAVLGSLGGLFGAAATVLRRSDAVSALGQRAHWIIVGAALVGGPLVAGQAWAYADYFVTREVHARKIIDGLQSYAEREEMYPDELEELITAGDIDGIPEPAIGFDFLYDGAFRYQSFGTSYILEFPAPRWVECAYTPPYEDEPIEDDEEYEDEFAGEDSLDEAWSCPSAPPELW